ncbi:UDP-glucose flavonoid 3-O-glucosyltransferase 7-like [Tripterygium wilfordii]|uniref:UDP-glucose flavonoid 3-O-glucosyltransferase 7-like n=1 Tax=Tripterygium wilfordii TaxID=458696 RepID=UPI0018F857FF|nr:UDP-glucose flavonoid 3-O-glucosyltransferase 7-like [Tripterygium wilfordii]
MASTDDETIHVMFLPHMAPGHMIPMVDIARLFAANDVEVTIITTTTNAIRFQNAIDRDVKAGRNIRLEIIPFPFKDAGLPEGCENLISTATPEMTIKLFHGIDMLRYQIEKLFRSRQPDCIVSDHLFPWTTDAAAELGIPRLAFSGSGFFNLCVTDSLERYQPHNNLKSDTSDNEEFVVPYLPDQVTLTRSQLPDIIKEKTKFSALFDKIKEAERKSFGVLMNSFYELEPAYADHFMKVTGMKAWHIGPISLFNKDDDDKAERGDKSCVSRNRCLNWLDSKNPNSVLYICFGSLVRFSKTQITEIASALEDSGHFFVWVVGKLLAREDEKDQQQESWLPEAFEDRIFESGRGLILRGWAPQVLILEHPAIGGFLTHCGWNSILEGLCAGVPMITWPIFAEQFNNEKLVTQVLKVGVPVGNETWRLWATGESPLISREKITRAVTAVMGAGDEPTEMRKRASQLDKTAHKAIEECGSSYNDMKSLIEEIRAHKPKG